MHRAVWFLKCYPTSVKLIILLKCVVPENIHTPTTEGHWKFRGGWGLKGQNFYEKRINWNFQRCGGFKPKDPLWGGGGVWIFSGTTQCSSTTHQASLYLICFQVLSGNLEYFWELFCTSFGSNDNLHSDVLRDPSFSFFVNC